MFDLHARFHQKAVFDPYTYFFIFIVLYKTVIVLTQLCNCTGCVQHVSVLQLVFSGRQFPHKEFVSSSPWCCCLISTQRSHIQLWEQAEWTPFSHVKKQPVTYSSWRKEKWLSPLVVLLVYYHRALLDMCHNEYYHRALLDMCHNEYYHRALLDMCHNEYYHRALFDMCHNEYYHRALLDMCHNEYYHRALLDMCHNESMSTITVLCWTCVTMSTTKVLCLTLSQWVLPPSSVWHVSQWVLPPCSVWHVSQ